MEKNAQKKNKKDVHKTYIDLQNCVIGIAMEIKFPQNNKKIRIHIYILYTKVINCKVNKDILRKYCIWYQSNDG